MRWMGLAVVTVAAVLGGYDFARGKRELAPDEVQRAVVRELSEAPDEALLEFYAARGHGLAWCDGSGEVLRRARVVLDALRRSAEHGLDPEDYAPDLLERLEARTGKRFAASHAAAFDVRLTAAFFRYASDVSGGRLHPDEIRDDWHANPPEIDLVAALERSLEGDLPQLLRDLPPPHAGYARLRRALLDLREIEARGGWPTVPDGPSLEVGGGGTRVVLLAQRLAHDLADDRFDEALAEAVRRFQAQHGVEPDGKVGPLTLAELNVDVEQRIRQVALNLERWRWIPRRLDDPHVAVNIPGFDLALVRDGTPVWRTRIVVGRAYTPTPVFSDRIVSVIVNPPWNVPESIAVGEFLPELRNDASALERRGLRLFEGAGEDVREIDPRSVDWSRVDAGRFPYRVRQDPGPDNALGRLKFDLTNKFHIYLHDTPAHHLFGQAERGLSHGCVRVERPFELAAEILGPSSGPPLLEALDRGETFELPVDPPMPVYLLYWTAWADEDRILRFAPDLYQIDLAQLAVLERL